MYEVVDRHLEAFLSEAREQSTDGKGIPSFVEAEFRKFLACGRLDRGFLLFECEACGEQRPLAFSCKGRGFCPSCLTRRMKDSACHLVDRVLPFAPYRQWVLSFPLPVRYRLAFDKKLTSDVVRIFIGQVFAWQRRQAKKRGLREVQVGAVSFLQRFGSAINLNVHLHVIVPDGVFTQEEGGGGPKFHRLERPTPGDLAAIAGRVAVRVQRRLGPLDEIADLETPLPATWLGVAAREKGQGAQARHTAAKLCAEVDGYSLEAGQQVHAHDREGLARLCRYGARPPLSLERLTWAEDGRLRLRMKRPFADGTTSLLFTPVELLRRLAWLVPPPGSHLVRYHGLFAPAAKFRPQVASARALDEAVARLSAPSPGEATAAAQPDASPIKAEVELLGAWYRDEFFPAPYPRDRYLNWAALLARIHAVDALSCPKCGSALRLVATMTDPEKVAEILDRLGLMKRRPPSPRTSGPPG